MKTNYTIKTVKKGLAIFAIALGSTFASAQTATVYEAPNLRVPTNIYAPGAITMVSEELTHEGTTFKLQVTATPSSSVADSYIESNAGLRWGVNGNSQEGDTNETVVYNNITIIDFDDHGTGYTAAAISGLHFVSLGIRAANNNAADNPRIIVDGSNAGTFDIGQLTATSTNVLFGDPLTNTAGTVHTVGSVGDVTSVSVGATGVVENSFVMNNVKVGYTFTTVPGLSVDDIQKNNNAFAIYPTVVENTFAISKDFKSLNVIDLTGKTVKTFQPTDTLEVSGLGSGLYILQLKSDTGIATKKFMVK
ncbi:T9SS type A sorting domain-containing protein [Tamlana sp. 1_MG-2023]|uniref:T9SS type A sorting domain-containing protein n=1 Tax=Tamlana sp. 1_MG-2023 TaxID=3062628 RepID=UPI0026E20D53|nr:T9SS type A sorting domain-containing protein [Tamlana sp. 1_MG-2023]MDO6792597.1 T9SS type A sorting domain-containing protein [Tamlana sp. 1_MG-2023]